MAKAKAKATENNNDTDAGAGTAIVTQDDAQIMQQEADGAMERQSAQAQTAAMVPATREELELMADLNAEIEADLSRISVDSLSNATSLLGVPLSVHDAFSFDFTGAGGEVEPRIVFVVTDPTGIQHNVAQSPVGSRLNWINLFNNVRKAGRRLTLTDCEFYKLTGKGKFGNEPILLRPTRTTQKLIDNAVV